MNRYILVGLFTLLSLSAMAQESSRVGLAFELGASVNYYHGRTSEQFDDIQSERLNWQANGMLGLRFNKKGIRNGNIVGLFGTYGTATDRVVAAMLTDQNIPILDLSDKKFNNFYNIEAGVVMADFLRVSTGAGRLDYEDVFTGDESLYYLSSTAGLMIRLGAVRWNIDCNFMYGRDFGNTVIRPSTGFSIIF